MYLESINENGKISTCIRLDLETIGSRPIVPKTLPKHPLVLNIHCYNLTYIENGERYLQAVYLQW